MQRVDGPSMVESKNIGVTRSSLALCHLLSPSCIQREGRGTQQSLAALNGSISLLDREGKLDKEDLSNVLNAEIKTR